MKAGLLLLGLLAILLPTAQAQDGPYEAVVEVGPDQVVFENRFAIFGTQAASMRGSIDRALGDGDGTLTTAEVDIWKKESTGMFSDDKPECFENFEFLRLDGRGPLRISQVSVDEAGLAAAADSQDPFDFSFRAVFQYRAPTSDRPMVAMNLHDATFYEDSECYLGANLGVPGEEPIARVDVVIVHPIEKVKIVKGSVAPSEAQRFWDGSGLRFESQEDIPSLITFNVDRSSSWGGWGSFQDMGPVIGYAAAGTLGVLGLATIATEIGRYKLLRWLFVLPGFTRVEKDEVLDHSKREQLYNFIKANAGPSFSDLRRSLELSNGTLVHHLRILEAQGYVKGERDGFRTRFYIRGPKVISTSYLTRTQQQLLEVIRTHPGFTQKELAQLVGLPRQSVTYHTKQLAAQGKLEVRQDGNRRRYWLRPAPASPPGTVPRQF